MQENYKDQTRESFINSKAHSPESVEIQKQFQLVIFSFSLIPLYQIQFRTCAVVDGEFLSDTPANLYSTGQYNHVNILLGTNADEGTSSVLVGPYYEQYFTSEVAPFISRDVFELGLSLHLNYAFGKSEHLLTMSSSYGTKQKLINVLYTIFALILVTIF